MGNLRKKAPHLMIWGWKSLRRLDRRHLGWTRCEGTVSPPLPRLPASGTPPPVKHGTHGWEVPDGCGSLSAGRCWPLACKVVDGSECRVRASDNRRGAQPLGWLVPWNAHTPHLACAHTHVKVSLVGVEKPIAGCVSEREARRSGARAAPSRTPR